MATGSSAHDGVEVLSWALLAAATVGSAWCAYQESLWSGEQARSSARATVTQFESSRRTTIANRNLTIDVATFLDYLAADLHGDAKVAAFLREHARAELKPALEAWIADKANARVDLPTPFARPQYRLADQEDATALDARATAEILAANAANAHADVYGLYTVLFALSLFFLGATSTVRHRGMRRAMLVFGALIFTLSVVSLAQQPRASGGRPERVL
jgi:hypothetical protein